MKHQTPPPDRVGSIDIARGIGLLLVYYGHILERVMHQGYATASTHYTYIYTFHMPLFFVLSGFVFKDKRLQAPVRTFLRSMAVSRFVPYLFFCVVFCLVAVFVPGWFPAGEFSQPGWFTRSWLAALIGGMPLFAIPMWFLACLISVEVLHYVLNRITGGGVRLYCMAALLFVGGYVLNDQVYFIGRQWNIWLMHEAIMMYAFYLLGVVLGGWSALSRPISPWLTCPGAALCAYVLCQTFALNEGPFRIYDAVVIVLSAHGQPLWFLVNVAIGITLVFLLAKGLERFGGSALAWVGRNALVVFVMNSVFYHYLNGQYAGWMVANSPDAHAPMIVWGTLGAVVSIALCVPAVFVLERLVPQLIGKPTRSGPILPRLL